MIVTATECATASIKCQKAEAGAYVLEQAAAHPFITSGLIAAVVAVFFIVRTVRARRSTEV